MIDDRPGLHEPRFPGPEREARHEVRVAAAGPSPFGSRPPAVTVVVKRRRGAVTPEPASQGSGAGPGANDRQPRVHQIRDPMRSAAAAPEPAAEGLPPEPTAADASRLPAPVPRRRARRDPLRAPGAVTRTVFETAAAPSDPPSASTSDEPTPVPRGFIERPEVGYEQVMAELRQLRAQLDAALGARKFRIG